MKEGYIDLHILVGVSVGRSVCMSPTLCAIGYAKEKNIWLSPMTKALTPTEKSKKQSDNTKMPQKDWLHNECGPT